MAPRQPLDHEQRRLLRITARMPLASAANLASVTGLDEERVRRMLNRLRSGGWVSSVMRGMTETQAAPLLPHHQGGGPALHHRPPAPQPQGGGPSSLAWQPSTRRASCPRNIGSASPWTTTIPSTWRTRATPPSSPASRPTEPNGDGAGHEHPPWTATSRGVAMSLRRLAMLEPVYRLAPDLLRSGRVNLPAGDAAAATRDARMTDFRLLRHGGFYHAVARYGEDLWTTFTYAGLHSTERVLRRKEQHRFWGVDCYSSEEGRYLRIGNRTFYEDPDQEVEPSGLVVVAVDAWARELARNTLSGNTPTIFCTPDGNCTPAVELRPSRDLVSDPSGHPSVGRPEAAELWLRRNPDMAGHRRRAGPPAVPGRLPVPRHADVLAPGDRRATPVWYPATCAVSWTPVWWRCSTAGTTCRSWECGGRPT